MKKILTFSNNYFSIFIIFATLSLEYSIINIDFYFLGNISNNAITAVSSILWLVFLVQTLIGYFITSQLDNALFYSSNNTAKFNANLSAVFILNLLLAIIIIIIGLIFAKYFIASLKLNATQKLLALQYLYFMLPFVLFFAVYQFCSYVLYSINKPYYNLSFTALIIILNIILNYIFINYTNLQIKGIALASAFSIIIVLPLYITTIFKNNIIIKITNINKQALYTAYIGFKKLSGAGLLEPILYRIIQSYIIVLLSNFALQGISSKVVISNYLSYSIALATAFSIFIQFTVSKMLNNNNNITNIKNYYKNLLLKSFMLNASLSMLLVAVIFLFKNKLLVNQQANYFTIILLFSLLIEPLRSLSIVSKAYLKGLQQANVALGLSVGNKLLIQAPLLYVGFLILKNYSTSMALIFVLSVETTGYLFNFIFYNILAIKIHKKYKKVLHK